jgi:ribosomal protein L40E
MTLPPTIFCDACSTINPSDADFCRKCAKPLVPPTAGCERCGTRNPIDAEFCSYCASSLAPAGHGLTSARAAAWWQHMSSFGFYAKLWRPGGIAMKCHDRCMDLQTAACDDIRFEHIAFILPIVNRDWCVTQLEWQGAETTAGEILFTADGLVLFDLRARRAWQIPYDRIKSYGYSIWWEVHIDLERGEALKLFVKRGGGRVALYRSADELLASTSRQTADDLNRGILRLPPKYWDDVEAHDAGFRFWYHVFLFLLQVLTPYRPG